MYSPSVVVGVSADPHEWDRRFVFGGLLSGDFGCKPGFEIDPEYLQGSAAGLSCIDDPAEWIRAGGDAVGDHLHAAPDPGFPHFVVNIPKGHCYAVGHDVLLSQNMVLEVNF